MDTTAVDTLTASVWRFGDSWMWAINARDEDGQPAALAGGLLDGTHRPLTGLQPIDQALLVLYSIAVQGTVTD